MVFGHLLKKKKVESRNSLYKPNPDIKEGSYYPNPHHIYLPERRTRQTETKDSTELLQKNCCRMNDVKIKSNRMNLDKLLNSTLLHHLNCGVQTDAMYDERNILEFPKGIKEQDIQVFLKNRNERRNAIEIPNDGIFQQVLKEYFALKSSSFLSSIMDVE